METIFEFYWRSSIEHEKYCKFDKLKPKEVCRDIMLENFKRDISNPDYIFLIAELDGKDVGMVMGHMDGRDEPGIYVVDKMGSIDDCYVFPELRGKGIAKQLMDAMYLELKSKGAPFVGLAVIKDNPAFKLHSSRGFNVKSYWMTKE